MTVYNVYNEITGGYLFSTIVEPEQDVYTTVPYAGGYAKPVFANGVWVNEATAAEQSAYEYAQRVDKWRGITEDVNESFNDAVMEPGADAVLNAEYPEVSIMFRVYAPHVGAGVMYLKITAAIWAELPLLIAK